MAVIVNNIQDLANLVVAIQKQDMTAVGVLARSIDLNSADVKRTIATACGGTAASIDRCTNALKSAIKAAQMNNAALFGASARALDAVASDLGTRIDELSDRIDGMSTALSTQISDSTDTIVTEVRQSGRITLRTFLLTLLASLFVGLAVFFAVKIITTKSAQEFVDNTTSAPSASVSTPRGVESRLIFKEGEVRDVAYIVNNQEINATAISWGTMVGLATFAVVIIATAVVPARRHT